MWTSLKCKYVSLSTVSYHTNSEALYVSAEYVFLVVTSTGEVMGDKCADRCEYYHLGVHLK